MEELRLTEAENKLAEIIWTNELVSSSDLVKLCRTEIGWKKSTTYTMLKKLEKKGVFENRKGTVSAVLTREEFYTEQSKQILDGGFGGSLPRFLAAFANSKKLSGKEIDELQKLIDSHKEE
ncbi:MAG: BlaI/MecI/CopY family transcriptional regulator [Peptostreptococcaceae bacterium]|nr:BlaI/MecI/CopY family transcriptional regulator [Peptostreptococcaceae bacterium]